MLHLLLCHSDFRDVPIFQQILSPTRICGCIHFIGSDVFPLAFVTMNVVIRWTTLRSRLNSQLFRINFLHASIIRFFKAAWRTFWILVS